MKQAAGIALLALAGLAMPVRPAEPDSDSVRKLFNGRDLTNFYTYLTGYGKNNDPKKVFTVDRGTLHVSGEVWGGIITEKEYGNYRLIVEFKWGQRTFAPRDKAARDSGILVHAQGADGSFSHWMPSIECQMIEGGTGDFLVLSTRDHPFSLTVESEPRSTTYRGKSGEQLYYKPGATPRSRSAGRFNWWGRDPNWDDIKGFRGKRDVERPVGQWNVLEIIADGDTLTVLLNDRVVNKGTKCSHTKGKILLQSEGAEVFFRRVDLSPVSTGKRN